ncbi:hypothetical protein H2202_006207 [Exophiala xenobiotica]|nr:hypothetical protein H2202_006207 [Exophiala xenobiotica]KAK5317474.1 hypothetical protein LTR93_008685 [Exophiala xenobiotica]
MEPMPLSQDSDCYHPPLSADLYQVGPLSPISEEASTPKTATPHTVKDAHDSHLQQESFDAQENIARPGDADQTRPAHTTSAKVGLQITDNVLILTDKLLAEDMFQIPRTFCTQIDEEIEEDGATGSTDMSYLRKHLKLAENRLQIAQSGVALAENRLTLAKSQLALAGSRVKYLKDHIKAAKEKRRFDQY